MTDPEPREIEYTRPGLLDALLAVRAEMPKLERDQTNPHFGSKFTSLGEIVAKIDPVLRKHGLLWTTFPAGTHQEPKLAYQLAHVPTGETARGEMPLLLSKNDSQGLGSALTYARRYSLSSVLNLVSDEDDDGAAASAPQSRNGGDTVNMIGVGRGLSDDDINQARKMAGLDPADRAFASLAHVLPEKAKDLEQALESVKTARKAGRT